MYGYIVPDLQNLKRQDFLLFQAYYCGMCHLLGESYGQVPRLLTNYEMTFFAAMLHDLAGQEVTFETKNCIGNPFQKHAAIKTNPLFERISAFNVLLAYHKACDDVEDEGSTSGKVIKRAFKKPYQKAAEILPKSEKIIVRELKKLHALEKQKTASFDIVSDCFARLMAECAADILSEAGGFSPLVSEFFFYLGRWVYLMDALDDIDEDFKSGSYNPLLEEFKNFSSRRQFFLSNSQGISFLLNITTNKLISAFNGMRFTQCYDLLQNVVYLGLRKKNEEMLCSEKKLPRPRLNYAKIQKTSKISN